MAKSRNYLRRRRDRKVCQSKVKYDTKKEARSAAYLVFGNPNLTYRCPGMRGQAKHYHITSGRKR